MTIRFLYHLELRTRDDGREEQTLAFISPTLSPILDFMTRNLDGGGVRPEVTWWWAITLEEIGADWALPNVDEEVDNLWFYSNKGELMNYQPCYGYLACGPINPDPDYPAPTPPPEIAGAQ